jgi:hypothetical protein
MSNGDSHAERRILNDEDQPGPVPVCEQRHQSGLVCTRPAGHLPLPHRAVVLWTDSGDSPELVLGHPDPAVFLP